MQVLLLLFSCLAIATTEEPLPGNRTDFTKCKVTHLGIDYMGDISRTESKAVCQSWTAKNPVHNVHASYTDDKFPELSKEKARNYCRNPNSNPRGPWCYTTDPNLSDDACDVPLCSLSECRLSGPGAEYAGNHSRASTDAQCLKWNKSRKRVRFNGTLVSVPQFPDYKFPENDAHEAGRNCRNPDGDPAGPWCFTKVEYANEVEKRYCDVPFCDGPDCLVFARNLSVYTHYFDFDGKLDNFSFGVKVWNPDSYLEAEARLLLSLMPVPATGKDIENLGVGIEVKLTNKKSALTFGNKDWPEYEDTHGILKSTEYTYLSLGWDRGFLTLVRKGQTKPVFLQEYKTKNNLLGKERNQFLYYSVQGTNVLWSFPFCEDDDECDVHTTSSSQHQNYFVLEDQDVGKHLDLHVRAVHSATIILTASPVLDYPNVRVVFGNVNGVTKVTCTEYRGGPTVTLAEEEFPSLLSYWEWRKFSIVTFAGSLHVYVTKDVGTFMIMDVQHEVVRSLRWFSPASVDGLAHWTFYCEPPNSANPIDPYLPECSLNEHETNYQGTQSVTASGLLCLPWSGKVLLPTSVQQGDTKMLLEMRNYCRDFGHENAGTYCYAISEGAAERIDKHRCNIRKCKSAQCKMAGTGNDYIGKVGRTRSNRTCQYWITEATPAKRNVRAATNSQPSNNKNTTNMQRPNSQNESDTVDNQALVAHEVETYLRETASESRDPAVRVHYIPSALLNDTLYPDMTAKHAKNYCRNPSRSLAGLWCYTTDKEVESEPCYIPDCDRNEECTVFVRGMGHGRYVYILPQWKEEGAHGGVRFSVKQWDPDLTDGIRFEIYPLDKKRYLKLIIGAENNEKVLLYRDGKLVKHKTLPHIVPSGKWVSLWLQIRRGTLILGYEGLTSALFEWTSIEMEKEFVPVYMSYSTAMGHSIGVFFECGEYHMETTTTERYDKVMPINVWTRNEQVTFRNLTLYLRGEGEVKVRLLSLPGSGLDYVVTVTATAVKLSKTVGVNRMDLDDVGVKSPILHGDRWTLFNFTFGEGHLTLECDNATVLQFKSTVPLLFYYFSVAVADKSWATWVANNEPYDIDGPPKDGGWSRWSDWVCSVTCGGGEGFRTRTCSNPRPNIFGQLCKGSPTSTGRCNEFECGDLSPRTFDLIRKMLETTNYSVVVDEGATAHIPNNVEVLAKAATSRQRKEGSEGITIIYKSMWRHTRGKKIEVAMKILKSDYKDKYLKEFLELSGHWAFLQSNFVVKLFGVTLTSQLSMVLEYVRLGPLDQYLRERKTDVKIVDLLEASSNLASALWHLAENGIVHGNIRCRKLLVSCHDENRFTIKLSDPGIHTAYASKEVHWIPIECYANLDFARRSTAADVWAFATTLWEIFMYGESIKQMDHIEDAMRNYANGKRLLKPNACPNDIYKLMYECWDADPHRRKRPHAIMRDINQMLYQVYNSRKRHAYTKIKNLEAKSMESIYSNQTESTNVTSQDELISVFDMSETDGDLSSKSSMWSVNKPWSSPQDGGNLEDAVSCDFSNMLSNFNFSTATTSLDSINSIQSIFELDDDCNVVLQGRIGQGFYGEVYKGTLEHIGDKESEPRLVAVKKLKPSAVSSCLQDFEREISIMKTLKHPNIVEIFGVLQEPEISLVMEFVQHGSLQSFLKIYKDSLSIKQLLNYALDIAKGMDYLGKKNIVHRDLAARNILVVDENHVKISDFGLARVIDTNNYYILKTDRELPIKWYALESLRDGKFSTKSDVWSYGVTMCEMFSHGEEPNLPIEIGKMEGQILVDALEKGIRFPCPPNCPQSVYVRLIHPCWLHDQHVRPPFVQLCSEIEELLTQY